MQQSKIIFRADGSPKLGYGHVHRLLALAEMLHGKFDCAFVSHEASPFLAESLQQMNVPFIQVPVINYDIPDARKENAEVAFDMDELLQGNEIVVLDGYWFGKNYQQAIKKKGCTLVYIDDLVEPGNIADCIINHSLDVSGSDYKQLAPSSSVYVGSQYSLINIPDQFRNHQQHSNIFSQLLIAMGGADPLNFTCKTILAYKQFIQRFDRVVVLTGSVYAHKKELQEVVDAIPQAELIYGLSKLEMLSLMQQSSTAIISASNMAMEYAHTGGALALIQTAGNQKNIYTGLIKNGAAISIEAVGSVTKKIVADMQKKQQELFDGKSGKRFIKLFGELEVQAGFTFIKAGREHLQATYEWAADPAVRAYSFNQNPISFEEHQNWYLKKIEQPGCMYLLGKWDNDIVGSLRFDITYKNALISYLVSPKYHGKGLGRVLLAKGLDYLSKHDSTITTATGYVMPENIASVKVFERLGFNCTPANNQLCFTKNIYRS